MSAFEAGPSVIRIPFGRACAETRVALDLSQAQLADRVGVDRSYIAKVEHGAANPTIDLVVAIADALGIELQLLVRPPTVFRRAGQSDLVHARCSGHVDRRLRAAGWTTAREVEVVHGRSHGWIAG